MPDEYVGVVLAGPSRLAEVLIGDCEALLPEAPLWANDCYCLRGCSGGYACLHGSQSWARCQQERVNGLWRNAAILTAL